MTDLEFNEKLRRINIPKIIPKKLPNQAPRESVRNNDHAKISKRSKNFRRIPTRINVIGIKWTYVRNYIEC